MTHLPSGRAWSSRSIQARVVLLVGTGVLAALAILGGAAWVGIHRVEARLSTERLLVARAIAEHLDYLVQSDMEVLQGVSASLAPSLADRGQLPGRAALREAYLRARLVEHVVLIDAGGAAILREPLSGPNATPVPDARDVRAALTSGRPTVSNLTPPTASGRLYLLVPMRDWRGDVVAIAAGEIDPAGSRFSSALDAFRPAQGGSVDLLDGSGMTIASTDRARRLRRREDGAPLGEAIRDRTDLVAPGTGSD